MKDISFWRPIVVINMLQKIMTRNEQQQFLAVREILAGLFLGCFCVCLAGCGESPKETTANSENTENSVMLPGLKAKPKVTITGGTTVEGGAEFDFGAKEVGQAFEHEFRLKNDGDTVLEYEKGPPSCATCTSFEVDKLSLEPGETATIIVKWKINSESPEFRQWAPLVFDKAALVDEEGKFKFFVRGKVVRRVLVRPAEKWDLGIMDEGQPLVYTGTVTSATVDDFKITSIKATNPKLEVTYAPMTSEKLTELKLKSGFDVKCVLAADVPVGEFQDKINFEILSPNSLSMSVDVTAKRSGPMEIFGTSWDAKRMMVKLSSFDAAKDYSQRLNLYTRGIDGDLVIEKIETADPRFSAEIKLDTKFKGNTNDHRRYDLFIKYKGGNREAVYSLQSPLELVVHTNQPKIGSIKIGVLCAGRLRD